MSIEVLFNLFIYPNVKEGSLDSNKLINSVFLATMRSICSEKKKLHVYKKAKLSVAFCPLILISIFVLPLVKNAIDGIAAAYKNR